jgi:hypothetical protein
MDIKVNNLYCGIIAAIWWTIALIKVTNVTLSGVEGLDKINAL